jgi:hypothetical protein
VNPRGFAARVLDEDEELINNGKLDDATGAEHGEQDHNDLEEIPEEGNQEEIQEEDPYDPETFQEHYYWSENSDNQEYLRATRVVPWHNDDIVHAFATKATKAPEKPSVSNHRVRHKGTPGSQPHRDPRLQKCIEVSIEINGLQARALLDPGSTTDMVSPDFVRVAKLVPLELEEQMALQLAVIGSRSKINYGTWAQTKLGPINEQRYFDISSVDDYDVILGTPFCWANGISPIFEEGGWVMHKGKRLNLPGLVPGSEPVNLPLKKEKRFEKCEPQTGTSQFFQT